MLTIVLPGEELRGRGSAAPARPQLDDPDDEMVLEAAVNGRADALVTYSAAHFQAAAVRFGMRLVRPAEILHEVIEP